MLKKIMFAAILIVLTPLTAGAQGFVDASEVGGIAGIVQDEGYRAVVGRDSVGDPMITSTAHGQEFTIYFYGCEYGENCRDVQFRATFDMEDGMSPTKVQDFNRENRWGKVYLDEDSNPVLEMDVNLYGYVFVTNFKDTLDWWVLVMQNFIEYIAIKQ